MASIVVDGGACERILAEFRELAARFNALDDVVAGTTDASLLNRLLDELNCLLPPSTSLDVDHELVERLLCSGVTYLVSSPSTSTLDHLLTKFSPLIVNLLRRTKIVCKETASTLLKYHTTTLQRCAAWVRPYLLNSLGVVLLSAFNWSEFLNDLIGPEGLLSQFAADDDWETRRCALKCLENLTLRSTSSSGDYLEKDQACRCLGLFLENLRWRHFASSSPDKIVQCKILVSSLVGAKNLVIGCRMSDVSALGELLAVMKGLMFYCLPGYTSLPSVDCIYPSPLSQTYLADAVKANQPSSPGPKNRKTNRKKHRSTTINRNGNERRPDDGRSPAVLRRTTPWSKTSTSSSESEQSDVEVVCDAVRLRSLQARVRSCAVAALAALFEIVNRKITFGYWSSFLPSDDVASASAVHGTLVGVFLKDPAPKVRSGALALLTTMLDGSKPFLTLADDRDRRCNTVAFTTLSQTLASMVRGLQRAIILALVSETAPLVLTQAIRCVAAVVRAAPLHRLAPGFAAKFIQHLKPMLDHKDSNVCVAVLTALGTIASVEPALQEVFEQLEEEEEEDGGDGGGSCWLIDVCVANVLQRYKLIPLPVRIESLQVLTALTRVYFGLVIRNRLTVVVGVIESGLRDADISVNLHSAKLMEEFGKSFANISSSSSDVKTNEATSKVVVDTWSLLIGTSLPRIGPENLILAAKLCDCLSSMSADIFTLLPGNLQVLCKTLLLGFSRDEDRSVKAASVRALGVFVLHPSIREDCEFLADVLNVVIVASTAADESADVRIKAAWTLANVTDALVLNRESSDGESTFLEEVIDDELLRGLCAAALQGTTPISDGNDRVRSNMVRALGNILRYFGAEHLGKKDFAEVAKKSIDALHRCASGGSNMKVRWNACYALGNAFRNRLLLIDGATFVYDEVLLDLSTVAKKCKNFKVRINAASALAVPTNREAYGDHSMAPLVGNLLAGLDNIQSSMDFVEYQHKDNLVEQLCTSLCHLIGLLRPSDVDSVSAVVEPYVEIFRCHLGRSMTRRYDDDDRERDVANETRKPPELVRIYDLTRTHLSILRSTDTNTNSLDTIANAFVVPQPLWDN